MKEYRRFLLNKLIDSYEKSKLFRGENQVNVHIDFKFSKHSLADYFDELKYELKDEINEVCKNLSSEQLIQILWKKFETNNVIDRIRLNINNKDEVYRILKRKNKKDLEQNMKAILIPYLNNDTWLSEFSKTLINRLEDGKSIKRYFDLSQPDYAKTILDTIVKILSQKEEIAKRMFSISLFNNSKYFEEIESKITMIMKEFGPYSEDVDVLAEENIMNNPGYVFLKGSGIFKLNQATIDLNELQGEIGLSTQLLKHFSIKNLNVRRVLTIENLTSFHLFQPKNELVIYLGGFHNTIRRRFLSNIYSSNKNIPFYHWGDIDLGGFRILNHLRNKTRIPFKPYRMDLETLKHFKRYAMKIDGSYQNKLKNSLNKPEYKEFQDVIQFMIDKNIRLEQEILG